MRGPGDTGFTGGKVIASLDRLCYRECLGRAMIDGDSGQLINADTGRASRVLKRSRIMIVGMGNGYRLRADQ